MTLKGSYILSRGWATIGILNVIFSEPSTRADAYRVQLYCLFLNISHAVHIYLEQLKCIAKSVVYYNYFCKKCVKKLT